MAKKSKSNELHLTRVYDAPVKLVWDAWTDPKQAAKWWGPRGFSITTHSKDLRPGGSWDYTMHGPDGVDYANTTKYYEVEKYSRLVYDHGGHADKPPLFRVTVQFTDLLNGKTQMDMTMTWPTAEIAEANIKFIKQVGGNSTWDRLAEYLAKETEGQEKFVINRSFDAPINVLFDMWTKPEHFSKWLPPTGFTMSFLRVDIKPGGSGHYTMTNGADVTMYGLVHYLEIKRPERLVYNQQFCDKNEKKAGHPLVSAWPETMKTTVLFTEEGSEQTRVTVIWQVEGKATAEEIATFVKEKGGMTQGWTGSFDKLEELLAKAQS